MVHNEKNRTNHDEIICLSLETPISYKLLSDTGIWITGAGATVYNTPHSVGMIELRKGVIEDSFTVVNDKKVESRNAVSVTGTVTNKKRR